MQRLILTLLLLHCIGCGREFERRKDTDLWSVTAQSPAAAHDLHSTEHYAATVTPNTQWKIHSSLEQPAALNDNQPGTAAVSEDDAPLGDWILIDLGAVCRFQRVHQLHPDEGGAPPTYRVDTADQHGFPYTQQFVGTGQATHSTATFARPINARFIRITVVEASASAWRVSELKVD